MGKSNGHREGTDHVGLYLVLEIDETVETSQLLSVFDAADWQSALIRGKSGGALPLSAAKPVAAELQRRGIVVLVADVIADVVALKADGLHVSAAKDVAQKYRDARAALGPAAIIGADAGRSRHDAMELGEGGADYVAFGIPAHVGDRATAQERQLDLIAWWSGIFELPSVAMDVEITEQAQALAAAGADFVSVTVSSANVTVAMTQVQAFFDALQRKPQIA